LIAKQRPFLKVEVFKLLNLQQRERLYDFLIELRYDVFRVESDANYRGVPLTRESLTTPRHYDVFCVPRS
jgi:hypothetical protein